MYRGVNRQHGGKWRAQICVLNDKVECLGTFPTEVGAAEAYDTAARRLGKPTNFRSLPSDQGCLPGMVLPYGSRCAIACDTANYLTMGDSFH